MVIKTKKTKKAKGLRGTTTHGHGARKKWKGKGHKGGKGMAGTGKRADHKKTLITAKYGNKYFGRQGITSKGTARKKVKTINLRDIQRDLRKWKEKDGWLDFSEYKLLGEGELKDKIKLRVLEASRSAVEKVKKVGGEIDILKKDEDSLKEDITDKETKQLDK